MRTLVAQSLIVVLFAHIVRADDPSSERGASQSANELNQAARSVWAAWQTGREKLQSARFRATGAATHLRTVKEDSVTKVVDDQTEQIDFRAAFDWRANSKKYEFSNWGFSNWPNFEAAIWAETDQHLVQFLNQGKGSVASIKVPGSERLSWARLIDPRVVGFASPSDMNDGRLSFANALERIDALPEPLDVRPLDDDRIELVYDVHYAGSPLWCRTSYVFNKSRGYTIESHRKVNHRKGNKLEVPIVNATCEWEAHGNAWIPITMDYYGRQSLYKIKLNFTWEAVNMPIAPQEFEISHLGIPEGTLVSDKRFNEPTLRRAPVDGER